MEKKLLAIVLAIVLVLATAGVALAHDESADSSYPTRPVAASDSGARAQDIEGDEAEEAHEAAIKDEKKDNRPGIELEGAIQELTSMSLTVNGKVIMLNGGTEVEGTLAIGAVVEVETVGRNGTLVAKEVEVIEDAATPPAAATVPSAPTGLTAIAASAAQVNLSWTDNSNDETGFRIQRATDSGFTKGLTTFTTVANATTYGDTTVVAGTTYYYRVSAYNGAGDSSAAEASVTTPSAPPVITIPAGPTNLTATTTSATQVNLSWTDNSSNEAGFHVQRATNSGFTNGLTTFSTTANVTTYSDTTVVASVTYYYRVTAYNSAGDSSASSTSVTTPATVPTAPTGLAATATSATQVNLSWIDNSSNETGFHVQRATNSGFTNGLTTFSTTANITTYSDTTVVASMTYYYRVTAYNSAGDSAASSTSVTTPAAPPAIDAAQLYADNCAVCHGTNRQGGYGPALTPTTLASRTVSWIVSFLTGHRSGFTTEEYTALAEWLKNTPP